MLLIFLFPAIAATIAVGSAGRKIAWYLGTVALVFFVDIFSGAVFMAESRMGKESPGAESLVTPFAMLVTNILIIAVAGSSGKKCSACQSRIHPKATRCPRCQANLA